MNDNLDLTDRDLEEIISIAMRRAKLVDDLTEALKKCDSLKALELARQVCGLPQEKPQ
jgi:hypothetical protein